MHQCHHPIGTMKRPIFALATVISCFVCSPAAAFQPITTLQSKPLHSYHPSPVLRSTHETLKPQIKQHSALHSSLSNHDVNSRLPLIKRTRATAVYALIMLNLGVFIADKAFRIPFVMRYLYLFHRRWSWWQPLTTCFCHTDRNHLSSNLFLLLLFGRSVEDDLGWGGLLLSYVFCGVLASFASLILLPRYTVSIGASGAVFGLFAVSTFTKLSWRELFDWRKLVEFAVLGEFVFRQLVSEVSTAAQGGRYGINHVAHLSGAVAGALLVIGMRVTVRNFERSEKQRKI